MLAWRLALSPILIGIVLGVFYLDAHAGSSAPYLLIFALLLGWRSTWELIRLMRIRSFEPQMGLVLICSSAVIASNWIERWLNPGIDIHIRSLSALGPAMLVYALVIMVLLLSEAIRYREPGKSMETLGAELIIVSYVGIFLSVTSQLRWVMGSDRGYFALGSLVFVAKCGDTGAFFFGKYWGKKKLAIHLSPGKTWAGAYAALVGASLGSVLWFTLVAPLFNKDWPICPLHWAVFFGVTIGLVGLVGDLCESLIKRDLGQKDAARFLPGFGGLLDVLDSVIYSAPLAYIFWLTLPLGGHPPP